MGKSTMSFLNKKAFHPGTGQNREKVWLREQEVKREKEQMDELRAQLEEERKQAEMNQLYTGSVHGKAAKKSTGTEWMYSQPMQGGSKDDYLMGKKYEEDKPDL